MLGTGNKSARRPPHGRVPGKSPSSWALFWISRRGPLNSDQAASCWVTGRVTGRVALIYLGSVLISTPAVIGRLKIVPWPHPPPRHCPMAAEVFFHLLLASHYYQALHYRSSHGFPAPNLHDYLLGSCISLEIFASSHLRIFGTMTTIWRRDDGWLRSPVSWGHMLLTPPWVHKYYQESIILTQNPFPAATLHAAQTKLVDHFHQIFFYCRSNILRHNLKPSPLAHRPPRAWAVHFID